MNTIDVKQSIADIIKTREPLVQRFDSMIGSVNELLGILRMQFMQLREARRLKINRNWVCGSLQQPA